MVDISVEAQGGDVRTEDSRTEVFHTAIGEAIGDPYEGHTTGEDTRTPTDDVATISVDVIAEAYTWREERTDRRQVVIRDAVFLSYSRAIEVGVSRRTVEEEGHIDTQTVSQAEVIGSLPLILSVEAQLTSAEAGSPASVARARDVSSRVAVRLRSYLISRTDSEEVIERGVLIVPVVVREVEVTHAEELVVRTEGQGVVAECERQVIRQREDVLIEFVSRRILVDPSKDLIASLASRTIDEDEGEGTTEVGALVADTAVADASFVGELVRELRVQLSDDGIGDAVLVVTVVVEAQARRRVREDVGLIVDVAVAQREAMSGVDVPVKADQPLEGFAGDILRSVAATIVAEARELVSDLLSIFLGDDRAVARGEGRGTDTLDVFAVSEEEELVAEDRTTEREADGVLILLVEGLAGLDVLTSSRAEEVLVVVVVVDRAVEGVGTRLRDSVHTATREARLTDVEGSDDDLQSVDSFEGDSILTRGTETEDVVIDSTVDLEAIEAAVSPCEGAITVSLRRELSDVHDATRYGRDTLDVLTREG